ncbi:hypothetical protein [Terrabacter sp. NPDC080008]|uniref:hypothetical protein n=1 Tax=Terrabacter sp. NPDC080008 TaxID=3155176 RepID=UPI00344C830B
MAIWHWVGRVVVLRILIPAMALGVLGVTIPAIGPALAASRGEGLPGTITVTREQCTRGGCAPFGRFTSNDGSVEVADAHLDGSGGVGDRVSVVYLAESGPTTVHVPGSRLWVMLLAFLLAASAFLAWWLWDVARAVGRRLQRG